jgi:hypothetical protein
MGLGNISEDDIRNAIPDQGAGGRPTIAKLSRPYAGARA